MCKSHDMIDSLQQEGQPLLVEVRIYKTITCLPSRHIPYMLSFTGAD